MSCKINMMSPPTRRWISSPSHFNRSARLCDWPITLVPDHIAVITDGVAAYLPQSESLCSGYGNLQPQTVATCFWTCSKIVSTSWSVLHSSAAILCLSHTGVQTCVSVPTTIIYLQSPRVSPRPGRIRELSPLVSQWLVRVIVQVASEVIPWVLERVSTT